MLNVNCHVEAVQQMHDLYNNTCSVSLMYISCTYVSAWMQWRCHGGRVSFGKLSNTIGDSAEGRYSHPVWIITCWHPTWFSAQLVIYTVLSWLTNYISFILVDWSDSSHDWGRWDTCIFAVAMNVNWIWADTNFLRKGQLQHKNYLSNQVSQTRLNQLLKSTSRIFAKLRWWLLQDWQVSSLQIFVTLASRSTI